MKKIIEKLKHGKSEMKKHYFDLGRKSGIEWCNDAEYGELLYAINYVTCDEVLNKTPRVINLDPTKDELLGDFFAGAMEHYEGFKYMESADCSSIPNELYRSWESGWKDSVLEFWKQVEPHLDQS